MGIQQMLMGSSTISNAVLPFVTVNGGPGSITAIGAITNSITFDVAGTISYFRDATNIRPTYKPNGSALFVRSKILSNNGGNASGILAAPTGTFGPWFNTTTSALNQLSFGPPISGPTYTATVEFQASPDGIRVATTSAVVTFQVKL